jgi:hypothetical protein
MDSAFYFRAFIMGKLLTLSRFFYLAYFSQPARDRTLYRAIRRGAANHILELGMGGGVRAGRLIEMARRTGLADTIHYTGIDLFELSPPGKERLSLKAAHCQLKTTRARVRLVPGDAYTALASAANHIGQCDLIVISGSGNLCQVGEGRQGAACLDTDPLARAWFYVPRLLHPATQVFVERAGEGKDPPRFELLAHDEIRRRAQSATRRRAA